MKKMIVLLLLALSLAGCGNKGETAETERVELIQEIETEPESEEPEETVSEEEQAKMEREAQLDRFEDAIKQYIIDGSSCKVESINQSVIEFNEAGGVQNLRILLYNGDEIEAASYVEEGTAYFNISKNDAVTMCRVDEPVDFRNYITIPSYAYSGKPKECDEPNRMSSKDQESGIEFWFSFNESEEIEKVEYKVYDYDESGCFFTYLGESEYSFSPDIEKYEKVDISETDQEMMMFLLNAID